MDKTTEQVLLGSMCGDGSSFLDVKLKNGNPYFSETHKLEHSNYLMWKSKFLKKYFNLKFFQEKQRLEGYKKVYNKKGFRTNSSYLLKGVHKFFYPKGKGLKNINIKMLKKLDWQGVAVWFVDDGHYIYRSNNVKITVNKKYHNQIITFFKNKGFNFKTNNHDLYLNKLESQKFIKKIKSYVLKMPKCVHYKIGLDKKMLRIAITKRKKYRNNYYQKNKEKENKGQMNYYWKNRELINKKQSVYNKIRYQNPKIRKKQKLYQKKYEKLNRCKISQKALIYYHKNKEKICAIRRWNNA